MKQQDHLSFNENSMWDVDVSAALPTLFNIHLMDFDSEDVKLYQYLTSQNDENYGIYDFLGELWGVDDRDEVKILTMVIFFGSGHTIKEHRQMFSKVFPNVYKRIKILKRGNYKFLAKNLMDLERKIMIDTVSAGLLKENKKMPLLTIHDGILTTEEFTEKTRSRIQKEIKDMIGIIPKVKIKPLII